ncbi:hypothetical protein FQN50_000063 [Emmonsiellopsis sp. PD_5]|nr:hypothetical protein FQN50_000063 [Emmonsiellopsis sp. PD_5]
MPPDLEKAEGGGCTTIAKRDSDSQEHAPNDNIEGQKKAAETPNPLTKTTSQREESILRPEPVPRSQRRGFLGHLSIIPELKNAYMYGNGTKWCFTVIVSLAAITSSAGSSIFYPPLAEVAEQLNTTPTVANLSLAFYMLAMAVTPIWWSAFSENHGRRTTYLTSFFLFLIFSCISAVSVNITMLIIFRILSGGAAASVQAVGAGTVSDIWEPKVRGRAMGVFFLGPLCGPGLAPVIGGALTQAFHWQGTLWFLTIFGGVMILLVLFFLPETVARREPKSKETGDTNKGNEILRRIFGPLKVLAMLRHPPIIIAVWSAAIAFGAMFVLNVSIQADFGKSPYKFSVIKVGLVYLAPLIGNVISSLLGGRWIDYIMAREARKASRYDESGKLKYLPEDRMKENIWIASTLYPAALIWFGWSLDKGLHWTVSCVACVFFGLGVMHVMATVTTMLTEFTPKRSSSGVAINNFSRNILSCTGAVITQPLIDAMGTGWMCTMVALFAFVTGIAAIMALKTWGPQWRVVMDKKLNSGK